MENNENLKYISYVEHILFILFDLAWLSTQPVYSYLMHGFRHPCEISRDSDIYNSLIMSCCCGRIQFISGAPTIISRKHTLNIDNLLASHFRF